MPSHGSAATRWIRWRLIACFAGFMLLLGGILARAVQLQLVQGVHLGEMARDQYLRSIALQPRRGAIVDTRGKPLAVSVDADSVYVDPKEFRALPSARRRSLQRQLARLLDLEVQSIHKHLTGPGEFAWIKRRITPSESEALHRLKLAKTGIATVREFRRFYPQKQLASHVVGIVDIDNDGIDGIEREEDTVLRGNSEELSSVRDAHGHTLFEQSGLPVGLPQGATVQLTLDSSIQQAAEDALAQGMVKTRALDSMAIVMNPRTGAILALANNPTYNPNAPGDLNSRRDRAVTDLFEPGSVMKCFMLSAALSEKLVTPQTLVNVTGGVIQIGRRHIHDAERPRSNYETVTQVLATSSNVGASRVGLMLGPDRLVSWLERFGFGERTHIALPGESRGVLQNPEHMGQIGTATTSFGQGMTATPLQIVTALSTIANEGRRMRPYIVQRVTDGNGHVLFEEQPEIVRQVITPEVAHEAREMMVAVTGPGGTGTLADIPGIRVAGKTGTAQKADPRTHTYGGKRFASFMGFVPADDPQLAIYVAFDEPQGSIYGGAVAAPVFRQIATAALLQLGIAATGVDPLAEPVAAHGASAKKKSARAAQLLEEDDDVPDAPDEVIASAVNGASTVPDLRGLSMRAALRALSEKSFDADPSGSGRVVSQQPLAGRAVPRGTRVRFWLEAG